MSYIKTLNKEGYLMLKSAPLLRTCQCGLFFFHINIPFFKRLHCLPFSPLHPILKNKSFKKFIVKMLLFLDELDLI